MLIKLVFYIMIVAVTFAISQFISGCACVFLAWALAKETEKTTRKPQVVVMGNIGAGKSRMLSAIESHPNSLNSLVISEPVSEWAPMLNSTDICDKYRLQLMCLSYAIHCCNQSVSGGFAVYTERDFLSQFAFCFEINEFVKLYREIIDTNHVYLPDVVLYIDTTVPQCVENIKSRMNAGDASLVQNDATFSALTYHNAANRILIDLYESTGVAIVRRSEHSSDADAHTVAQELATRSACKPRRCITNDHVDQLLEKLQEARDFVFKLD